MDDNSDIEITEDVIHTNNKFVENTTAKPNKENPKQSVKNRIIFEDTEFVLQDISKHKLYKHNENETKLNDIMNLSSSDSDDIEFFSEVNLKQKFKSQMCKDFLNKNHKRDTNGSTSKSEKEKKCESENVNITSDANLLVPVIWDKANNEMTVKEKIKQIERDIAICKKKIAHYEIKEVCDDTVNSPYLITLK